MSSEDSSTSISNANQNLIARTTHGDGVRADGANQFNVTRFDGPVVQLRPGHSMQINPMPWWKRGFDLVGASIGLIVLGPLMIVIALFIKAVSRGPVLFRHKRYGYRGQALYVWKFRSMHSDADPERHQKYVMNMVGGDSQLKKLDSKSDLIPCGKWLRCTAMDELPQLLNVLRGEMSLVGPRPDVVPVEQYQDWQQTRFDVLPGLTGLWQVSGKNHTTFNEMNQLDALYVEKRSLWLDLKIVTLTIPAIFRQVFESIFLKVASS